jgi:RNA polymerase sigma factor (TIGR02999 family)
MRATAPGHMNDEKPTSLRAIFSEALEIADPEERDRYLGRVCGSGTELRQKIELLINAHYEAGDFMRMPEEPCQLDWPAAELVGNSCLSTEQLVGELYNELRCLAAARISQLPPGQTLQATALVHEAYMRLSREPCHTWQNRAHFFASAAESMRRILVDQARRKAAVRRAGNSKREPLDELQVSVPHPNDRLLQVHDALDDLELENQLAAQIVKLRFFVGLNHSEVASLLGISEKTARRQWNFARIWLYDQISEKKLR